LGLAALASANPISNAEKTLVEKLTRLLLEEDKTLNLAKDAVVRNNIPDNIKSLSKKTTGAECLTVGQYYMGTKSTIKSGDACIRWDYPTVQTNADMLKDFFGGITSVSEASNYCRGFIGKEGDMPWCYVDENGSSGGYCDVPMCGAEPEIPTETRPTSADCRKEREPYTGTISTTKNGKTCQRWDETISGNEELENSENYCRNAFGFEEPFCFAERTLQFCDIPLCP